MGQEHPPAPGRSPVAAELPSPPRLSPLEPRRRSSSGPQREGGGAQPPKQPGRIDFSVVVASRAWVKDRDHHQVGGSLDRPPPCRWTAAESSTRRTGTRAPSVGSMNPAEYRRPAISRPDGDQRQVYSRGEHRAGRCTALHRHDNADGIGRRIALDADMPASWRPRNVSDLCAASAPIKTAWGQWH